jgi:NarL family two-component system response regulator LiaR
MHSIFIVDEFEITRMALRSVLQGSEKIQLVGESAGGPNTLESIIQAKPDVVLVDIAMNNGGGCEFIRELSEQAPDVKIAAFTARDDDQTVFGALNSGATGYIHKSVPLQELPNAIAAIAWGAAWLSPNVAKKVLCAPKRDAGSMRHVAASELTPRENEVLELLVEGLSNREIGEKLCLSAETVKTHVRHIMEKLSVNSRTQIAVKVCRSGRVTAA